MSETHIESRLERMEEKFDRMGEAITMLARIDERMLLHIEQAKRMAIRQEQMERRVDRLELLKAKLYGIAGCVSFIGSIVGPYIIQQYF